MYLIYSFLLLVGVTLYLPRIIGDALRHGKYAAGLGERLGGVARLEAGGRPVIWLHCVSVGETQAARPLVESLRRLYPAHVLVVSTTTLTGQRVARDIFKSHAAAVFYFPLDWSWTVRRALDRINPSVVLVMETELWPRFLRICRARRIPVALVNGRISPRSFRNYKLVRFFISDVVNNLSLAIMQAAPDAERITAMGLAPERVEVSGNIKFDAGEESNTAATGELRERFRLTGATARSSSRRARTTPKSASCSQPSGASARQRTPRVRACSSRRAIPNDSPPSPHCSTVPVSRGRAAPPRLPQATPTLT